MISLGKYITLDELIELSDWDLKIISFEKIAILQDILVRKKRQEEMRREKQQRKLLHIIKDIFIDAFDIYHIDEQAPIISQLV